MASGPSAAYGRALLEARQHHAGSKTYSGSLLRPHKPYLSELIDRLGIASALDYGAGKGVQYDWVDPEDGLTLEQAWGFEVQKFDPAWPAFAAEPAGQFDLVICTHTLGGIPLEDHGWVMARLLGHARKAVFIAEKIAPIKKKVHSDRRGMVNGWSRTRWEEHLRAEMHKCMHSGVPEVHLSTTTRVDNMKITDRQVL